jgi:hypothetical protein
LWLRLHGKSLPVMPHTECFVQKEKP